MSARGPGFSATPPNHGYAWWYLDGVSDDGQHGITVIAFIGSVFSPYYAWARRRGDADPLNFCSMNVALYAPRAKRWAMTERPATRIQRDATTLRIGASSMHWSGKSMELELEERCAPIPHRIRGSIRLFADDVNDTDFALDSAGAHCWAPIAPCARIEVSLAEPDTRWQGSGYLDSNFGTCPLESTFEHWNWSRSIDPNHCQIYYDVNERGQPPHTLALRFDPHGAPQVIDAPGIAPLPKTGWGISRTTRADAPGQASVIRTLEDAPFYSRSLLASVVDGKRRTAIHESLDLSRFSRPWVQCMLPFRMPRSR